MERKSRFKEDTEEELKKILEDKKARKEKEQQQKQEEEKAAQAEQPQQAEESSQMTEQQLSQMIHDQRDEGIYRANHLLSLREHQNILVDFGKDFFRTLDETNNQLKRIADALENKMMNEIEIKEEDKEDEKDG